MSTTYTYPAKLAGHDDDWVLTFPDIPEAITGGASAAEALANGPDCLLAALEGYVDQRRDIPAPGTVRRGQYRIAVAPVAAAKLALYQAMRDSGMTNVALAAKLGVTEGAVRKLLALRHRSHIDAIDRALGLFGLRLVVTAQPWAASAATRAAVA